MRSQLSTPPRIHVQPLIMTVTAKHAAYTVRDLLTLLYQTTPQNWGKVSLANTEDDGHGQHDDSGRTLALAGCVFDNAEFDRPPAGRTTAVRQGRKQVWITGSHAHKVRRTKIFCWSTALESIDSCQVHTLSQHSRLFVVLHNEHACKPSRRSC